MIASIIVIATLVVTLAGIWKTFTKAGEGGWKALIPIYNNYIMLRIGGHSGWWVLAFLLPAIPWLIAVLSATANAQTTTTGNSSNIPVGQFSVSPDQILGIGGAMAAFIIAMILLAVMAFFQLIVLVSVVMTYDLARSFGKGMAFAWGLIVLPFVFWPILGYGDAEYRGPVAHPNMVENGAGAHVAEETNSNPKATSEAPDNTDNENQSGGDPFVS
jgi:hypothetical protein